MSSQLSQESTDQSPNQPNELELYLNSLPKTDLVDLYKQLEELEYRKKYRVIDFMFPEKGEYRRELYPKHLAFFEAGKTKLNRGLLGGNGSGKTRGFGTEFTYHLTGQYPDWWKGKKFTHPVNAWGVARESKQLRGGMQATLFGEFTDIGTGLIPKECLLDDNGRFQTWAMSGTANCIGTCAVRHYTDGVFDGWSTIEFKTAAQGWQEFQGATKHIVWIDEEPDDPKVVSECFARTRGPKGQEGMMVCTFTPLLGYTTLYLGFLPGGKMPPDGIHPDNPAKQVFVVSLNDVPHVSKEQLTAFIAEWKTSDPFSIKARVEGIAALGTGRIYPIDEDWVVVQDRNIPHYWPKAYGLDPGWSNTAAVWIAEDPNTNIKYIYSEYKHGQVVYPIHAEAIKNRGVWITGSIDPQEAGKPRENGAKTIDYLISLGLDLTRGTGDHAALRSMILAMFESGALKITESCQKLLQEIRMYRYDEKDPNKPAKDQDDHLCDAMMYAIAKFDEIKMSYAEYEEEQYGNRNQGHVDDDGRNPITGY